MFALHIMESCQIRLEAKFFLNLHGASMQSPLCSPFHHPYLTKILLKRKNKTCRRTIQINQRLCNNWHCKDLTQKNSKSVTLILRSCTEIGMVQQKSLDKALLSCHNWIKSTEGFAKKTEIVKHVSQNFYIKILSLWPSGLGLVPYKVLDQFLSSCQTWINPSKASQKQIL